MKLYHKFNLQKDAELGMNYITSMVDKEHDLLPYWFVGIAENPAYAKHVRVDDAELVASWYEAIVALEKIIGKTSTSTETKNGFKRHLLKNWSDDGLRYHADYPWSNIKHASFHEQGWVLSGLNRLCLEEPNNKKAQLLAENLVKRLRELVNTRKIRTFWSGDYNFEEKIYDFPADLYIHDKGFVPERVTGRGEEPIRNAVLLEPLVTRAKCFNDKIALDLAEGIANHLLGLSRYFNWQKAYFGHVHSTMWFAIGLIKLGKLTNNNKYITNAIKIFEYTKSISSEFGWVPEYAQLHPVTEEYCETCCIKDMIEFALEAVEIGYDYWELIYAFTCNQLSEQQLKSGNSIKVDNSREDKDGHTWQDIDKRVIGGWSGGAEPASISLQRFRSIAGCCVGTAPVGLWKVWEKIIEHKNNYTYINLPIDKENEIIKLSVEYPNSGKIELLAKIDTDIAIRKYKWMGDKITILHNDKLQPIIFDDNCLIIQNVVAGDSVQVIHDLPLIERKETVRGQDMTVSWKGGNVVKMDPPGNEISLYQRTIDDNPKKKDENNRRMMPSE